MNSNREGGKRAPRALVVSKIEAAKHEMTEAEADIEKLLGQLRAQARAEKTTISQGLEAAFKKLRRARGIVEGLEEILATERDDT